MSWDPHRRQGAAILIKAIEDLSSQSTDVRKDAAKWFINNDFYINTFKGICFDIDMDHEKILEKLIEMGLDPNKILYGYKPERKLRLKKLLFMMEE